MADALLFVLVTRSSAGETERFRYWECDTAGLDARRGEGWIVLVVMAVVVACRRKAPDTLLAHLSLPR